MGVWQVPNSDQRNDIQRASGGGEARFEDRPQAQAMAFDLRCVGTKDQDRSFHVAAAGGHLTGFQNRVPDHLQRFSPTRPNVRRNATLLCVQPHCSCHNLFTAKQLRAPFNDTSSASIMCFIAPQLGF